MRVYDKVYAGRKYEVWTCSPHLRPDFIKVVVKSPKGLVASQHLTVDDMLFMVTKLSQGSMRAH